MTVFISSGLLFYLLNVFTPICADDFSYVYSFATGERISSLPDIFISQYTHYFTMNGRSVLHFLAQLFLWMGKPVFNVINTFAFLGLCVLIAYLSFGSIKKIPFIWVIAIYLTLWIVTPGFGDSFLWLTGAANYLYGILFICLYLIPFRKYTSSAKTKDCPFFSLKQLLLAIGYFCAGWIAGWTNENTGPALCGIVFLFLLYFKLIHRQWRLWMFTGWTGNIIGSLFVILCPAQKNRLDNYGGLASISELIVRATKIIYYAWQYLLPVLLFWTILAIIFWEQNHKLSHKEKQVKAAPSLILGCGAMASTLAMAAAPYFPLRAWSGIVVLLLVSAGMLLAEINFSFAWMKKITAAVVSMMMVTFAFTYATAFLDIHRVYQEDNARTAYVLSEKEKGNLDITVPAIYGETRYSTYSKDGDLDMDPTHWRNVQMAEYYEVNIIRKK